MTTISVNDLETRKDLDRSAMKSIKGGVMPRYVVRNGKVVMLTCTDPYRTGDRRTSAGGPTYGTTTYF